MARSRSNGDVTYVCRVIGAEFARWPVVNLSSAPKESNGVRAPTKTGKKNSRHELLQRELLTKVLGRSSRYRRLRRFFRNYEEGGKKKNTRNRMKVLDDQLVLIQCY